MLDILFMLVLALFVTHELDAIGRHEWRIFPITNRMNERNGYAVFVLAHLPLMLIIFWLSFGEAPASEFVRGALAGFAIVHVGLHWLYRKHPKNEFGNPLSQAIIWSTGGAGLLYLLVRLTIR